MTKGIAPLVVVAALASAGCPPTYEKTSVGRFEGVLEVRWLEPDRFLFVPNEQNPLRFVTSKGLEIRPGPMYTDGGSIPRLFWPIYSPWGYAPAYMVHDWLFLAHHCQGTDDPQKPQPAVQFDQTVVIMAESLKTLMAKPEIGQNGWAFTSIVTAIASPLAKNAWDTDPCDRPHDAAAHRTARELRPVLERRIGELTRELADLDRRRLNTREPGNLREINLKATKAGSRLTIERRRLAALDLLAPDAAPTKLIHVFDAGKR